MEIKPISPMSENLALKEMQAFEAMSDLSQEEAREQRLMATWIARVGQERAEQAMELYRQGSASRTLPELLVELALRKKGVRYRAQPQLPGTRPDFAIYGPQGVKIIRVQGDYWHNRPDVAARDALQKQNLIVQSVDGMKITKIVDIWEHQIYESERVVDDAIRA